MVHPAQVRRTTKRNDTEASGVSAQLLGDIPLIRVRAGARELAHEAPPSMPSLGFVCGAALSLGLWIVLGWIACRLLV